MVVEKQELDSLLAAYKAAVDEWRAAILAEENFATTDHSMKEWEIWDQVRAFKEEEARGEGESGSSGVCECTGCARSFTTSMSSSHELPSRHLTEIRRCSSLETSGARSNPEANSDARAPPKLS